MKKKKKEKEKKKLQQNKLQKAIAENKSARMPKAGPRLKMVLFCYSVWGFLTTSEFIVKWLDSQQSGFFRNLALVFIEFGVSLQLQTFTVALMALGLILLRFRREWTMIAIYSTLLTTTTTVIAPNFFGKVANEPTPYTFVVGTVNLTKTNRKVIHAIDSVLSFDLDLVLLQEASAQAQGELRKSEYPYQFYGNNGRVILSRFPVSDIFDHLTFTEFSLDYGGQMIRVVNADCSNPLGTDKIERRNRELEYFAKLSKAYAGPVIVGGDMSITPWSYFFRKLRRAGELYDSKVGFGLLGSWPAVVAVFRLPVDHILVKDSLVPVELGRIPAPGSSHFGLYAVLAVAEKE